MSFLAPLYIAGLLAISLPVVFHLIRRTPQGESPFSSLMFLSPSPPRITRRSRLEHWLLLLLRATALALLAAAFARPFWREAALANADDNRSRRIAVLVDTSASMRRGDLWRQAVRNVEQALDECRPQDEVGVFAFDETVRPIAGFEDLGQVDPGRRQAVVASRLTEVEPGWAATHLGQALVDAAALLEDVRESSAESSRAARQIVLVSDMQSGGRLQTVGDYPWPADVELALRPVNAAPPTNAGLQRLADAVAEDGSSQRRPYEYRIRVACAADSVAEQFRLQWTDATGKPQGRPVETYVPPGESRVVRVPQPPKNLDKPRLVLAGDAHDFDNTLYIVPRRREEVKVAYIGTDAANDPQGLYYYLEQALASDVGRETQIIHLAPDDAMDFEPAAAPDLAVIASPLSSNQAEKWRDYMGGGGTVLYVITQGDEGDGLARLLGVDDVPISEAEINDYAMLGEIDFNHPLFATMAGPRFNDFTQIHFWRYRRVELPEVEQLHIVARFERGDPAIIERRLGKGRLLAFTTSWRPADGQLARSWKFLLMLSSLVDERRGSQTIGANYYVNQRVELPERANFADGATVTRPDGSQDMLAADERSFADTAEPGFYTLNTTSGPGECAVNIDPAESDTAPLPLEAFEQHGCRLAGRTDATLEAQRLEQLRDVELESRQKLWQWLVAAALVTLVVETWLAGRLTHSAPTQLSPA